MFEQKPVLIERAETLSKISAVFQKHNGWLPNTGVTSTNESRVISLSGAVQHRCTVEVPTEMTLRDILVSTGAVSDHASFKAVLCGAPMGVLVSDKDLDLTLNELSCTGSTIDVISDDACIVKYTEGAVSNVQTQSCGECVFCREGTIQISGILRDIIEGEGNDGDLELVTELAEAMKVFSLCTIGKNAAEMVLSSLRLFRDEYELHMHRIPCN
jgi:NADH:ubiquinone oxidoreductase subunit F (NADH-binding)